MSTLTSHHHAAGIPTTILLPFYRRVSEQALDLSRLAGEIVVRIGEGIERVHLWEAASRNGAPRIVFIDHPAFSERPGVYGDGGREYSDNVQRFATFCAAAVAILPRVAPGARVVHAHDWHAALVPVYLRTTFASSAFHRTLATVLSVHNAAFQGHVSPDLMPALGLAPALYDWRMLEWYGRVNILKGGLAFADAAATVSPTHARELTEPEGGFGLHDAFAALGDRLVGIVNGIDQRVWNPATDPHLAAPFSASSLAGRQRCKAALQRACGLRQDPDVPVVAMCARMTEQKGIDCVLESRLLSRQDAQFVFLGEGEARFVDALRAHAARAPERIAVQSAFRDDLEHVLMAGADIFLIPSRFEPCGLAQMRAQRYGALPVARRVGGLADTIEDGVTGFLYDHCAATALDDALRGALAQHADRPAWRRMMRAAMSRDFGWARSAAAYEAVYLSAIRRVATGAADRPEQRT